MEAYKTSEVANILKVNIETVKNEINRGKLTAFKVGSEWRISFQALQEYMNLPKNNFKSIREIELEKENKDLKAKVERLEKTISNIKNSLLSS